MNRICIICKSTFIISKTQPYKVVCSACLKGKHKYNAVKTTVDGIRFDSAAEASMYSDLKLLQKAGKIKDLELQTKYVLIPRHTGAQGKIVREMTYTPDFRFFDIEQNRLRIIDCKGFKTKEYVIKKKLFNYLHLNDGLYIEETI